jgi:signal peptide peptidase SppA
MADSNPYALLAGKALALDEAFLDRFGEMMAAARPSEPDRRAGRAVTDSAGGAVAVLPVYGPLAYRPDFWSTLLGGSTYLGTIRALAAAKVDPNIRAVVLEWDSPGGEVGGVAELVAAIHETAVAKPVISYVNLHAASAAFWAASQADEVIVTASARVGAIGVFYVHLDASGMYSKIGINPTVVSAGKFKAEQSEFAPLSADARAYLQTEVNAAHNAFIAAVAAGRRVPAATVREQFGQGRLVTAEDAVRVGMADRVGGLDLAVARGVALMRDARRPGLAARAAADSDYLRRRLAIAKARAASGHDTRHLAHAHPEALERERLERRLRIAAARTNAP